MSLERKSKKNTPTNKSHYDVSEIEFSSPEFESEMLGKPTTFKDFENGLKIDLINQTIDLLCTIYENRYIPLSDAYRAIAKTEIADVFNYPVLVRCFVDTPIKEHNERFKMETFKEMAYDDLFRAIRQGTVPRWVDSKLLEYYHTGVLQPFTSEEESLSFLAIQEDSEPVYDDIDDFIEALSHWDDLEVVKQPEVIDLRKLEY